VRSKFKNVAVSICMLALSGAVYANEVQPGFELPTIASSYTNNSTSYMLALNEADASVMQKNVEVAITQTEFKPRLFTVSKAHKYLGLGTVLFAGLTALAAPDDGCEKNCGAQPPRQTSGTAHTRLARTTGVLAAATVASGLISHWDDLYWEDSFFDPDKMHARLGAAGALLMLYAINKSAHSTTPTSHAGTAELGAAMMAVAIKLTW
jgi:hypothetical protein